MRPIPYPKEIYRHFKGNQYEIVTLAKDADTEEDVVVYRALYEPYLTYVRGLEAFLSETDLEKYPDAKQKYRFEKVTESVQQELPVPSTDVTQDTAMNGLQAKFYAFLDAETYDAKLGILLSMRNDITEDMITAMAISLDHEVNEGSLEERFLSLKKCLVTLQKYEGIHLRE